MKMLDSIIDFFSKPISSNGLEPLDDYILPSKLKTEVRPEEIIDKIKTINFIDDSKPNILIMDDFPAMVTLLANELKRIPGRDVYSEFNIYSAVGEYAAFQVVDYFGGNEHMCFDLAFLDITLGGVIKGKELDGVDVAISIKECNPHCNIRFITGHTLNQRNPEIFKFSQKFKNCCELDIDEKMDIVDLNQDRQTIYKHVIGKNDNRKILMDFAIRETLDILKSEDYVQSCCRVNDSILVDK